MDVYRNEYVVIKIMKSLFLANMLRMIYFVKVYLIMNDLEYKELKINLYFNVKIV